MFDHELSARWWGRLSVEEKRIILKEHLPIHDIDIIDYASVYWLWLKKQNL